MNAALEAAECGQIPHREATQTDIEARMFTSNPFAALTDFLHPLVMQLYIVLMISR